MGHVTPYIGSCVLRVQLLRKPGHNQHIFSHKMGKKSTSDWRECSKVLSQCLITNLFHDLSVSCPWLVLFGGGGGGLALTGKWDQRLGYPPEGTWDQWLGYPLRRTWNQTLGYPQKGLETREPYWKGHGIRGWEWTRYRGTPPPPNRQTHVCEKITFPILRMRFVIIPCTQNTECMQRHKYQCTLKLNKCSKYLIFFNFVSSNVKCGWKYTPWRILWISILWALRSVGARVRVMSMQVAVLKSSIVLTPTGWFA